MKRIKFIASILLGVICLSTFSFQPYQSKIERNKEQISNIVDDLTSKNQDSLLGIKRKKDTKNTLEEKTIDENQEFSDLLSTANIDYETAMSSLSSNVSFINDDSTRIEISGYVIDIYNNDTLDFGFYERKEFNITESKAIKRAQSDSVTFTGISLSKETCMKVYDKAVLFADSIANKYSGALGTFVTLVYKVLDYYFPTFIAKFITIPTEAINKFTSFIKMSGTVGFIINLIIGIFAALIATILGGAIFFGAQSKGFRLGFEWSWFKPRPVFDIYD